ncbi:MAG TPA: proline dehydrogenase family protein [Dongiaceae bacterium]|jgi:proline dehydrogenase|nr:proline dehydrogenase family protein [Dongiaceae bacterium]
MKLWQSWMIALARSPRVTRWMQGNRATAAIAQRFVAGADAAQAMAVARDLQKAGFKASLYYLGEYVKDPAIVAENGRQKIQVAESLGAAHLQIHVSLDSTQIGYAIDAAAGEQLALKIGARIRELGTASSAPPVLMLNMEDAEYVERILTLRARLLAAGVPVAQTLQAYLKRSADDLAPIIAAGGHVRLVKGAFADPRPHAYQSKAEIDGNYLALARRMLSAEAKRSGFRAVFGTHDAALIAEIRLIAKNGGWSAGAYEFEMLYGVRAELQRQLHEQGEQVRLYLPFGRDWWPYAVRRVGESPRNAALLARAVVSG